MIDMKEVFKDIEQQAEEGETFSPLQYKLGMKLLLIGFALVILLAAVFWLGGWYTCSNSNGTHVGGITSFTCANVQVIKTCTQGGVNYVPEEVAVLG